jgi:hypothetical protein
VGLLQLLLLLLPCHMHLHALHQARRHSSRCTCTAAKHGCHVS